MNAFAAQAEELPFHLPFSLALIACGMSIFPNARRVAGVRAVCTQAREAMFADLEPGTEGPALSLIEISYKAI